MANIKQWSRKAWHFFWEDDSIWSWLANIAIAFVLIKFVVYPLLGLFLGTSYPLVAVISESMMHRPQGGMTSCWPESTQLPESFDNYWSTCGYWYDSRGVTKEQFDTFPFRDGFDKGDVILLWRANKENIQVGDILVFQGGKPQPIIHRVVKVWQEEGKYYYQTKGDHNSNSGGGIPETKIGEERVYGKGLVRVPYLGWVKIIFVEMLRPLGIKIER